MNIKEKLLEARIRLQEMNLKKSGMNKYAGYAYYELGDFLPVINKLGKELGFICTVSFTDFAKLEIIDTEKEENLVFTSPMSTASLKGCHEVQNLGAVETYLKRYLYQHAFEIVEGDALDSTHNPNEKPQASKQPQPKILNFEQQKIKVECTQLADKLGLTPEQRQKIANESKGNYAKMLEVLKGLEVDSEASEQSDNQPDNQPEIF